MGGRTADTSTALAKIRSRCEDFDADSLLAVVGFDHANIERWGMGLVDLLFINRAI